MKKNLVRKISIISLFLFFYISLAPIAMSDLKLSTADNVTDSSNDIIMMDLDDLTWKPTDNHTELDINTMIRSNQEFTITFNGIIIPNDTYYQYQLLIFEEYSEEEIYIVMFSSGLEGWLFSINGYWNGTGWDLYTFNPVSVGTIIDNVIEIDIPTEALTIQSSYNWFFFAMNMNISAFEAYIDICPDDYRGVYLAAYSGPSKGVFGYDLIILIGSVLGVIIIFTYIHIRKLKSGF